MATADSHLASTGSATWRDYYELGKPRVVALIVFTAVVGMFLAVPGLPPLAALLFGTLGIGLAATSAAAINQVARPPLSTQQMARTHGPADPHRRRDGRAGARLCAPCSACSMLMLWLLVNPLHRGAHLRLADRLRGALHGVAQARDAAEHRHRRRRRRRAAGAGLDRGHQQRRSARAAAVPDHLRVDAAALLGAGDRAARRLRAQPASRCCR